MFKLIPNYSLRHNNSFGLDVAASYWLTIGSEEDWFEAMLKYPHLEEEKRLIIGGGSNLLFLSDFDGLVVSPDIEGIQLLFEDTKTVEVSVGAGIDWDDFVLFCVEKGWYGVENLSMIPGRVGAAPVQNIGAYGTEVASVIVQVNGIDLIENIRTSFTNEQCHFGYRTSIFKEKFANSCLITSVLFKLRKQDHLQCEYADLRRVMAEFGEPNLVNLRSAVMQIRSSKLPDPKKTGNAGSFFKNPVVTIEVANDLLLRLPGLPVYPHSEGFYKLGAGFLIEQAGWKGRRWGNAAVHERQALVLVNRGGATGQDILSLSEAIQTDVYEKYGVNLEREVLVI